jgi:hypothetical protein
LRSGSSQHDLTAYRRLHPPPEGDWPLTPPLRGAAVERRDAGLQQVRRISAWTAAVLVAGTAAGVGYFARGAASPAAATPSASVSVPGVTHGSHKPSVSHPIVTSGGSGVTAGGPVSRTGGASWGDN